MLFHLKIKISEDFFESKKILPVLHTHTHAIPVIFIYSCNVSQSERPFDINQHVHCFVLLS